MKFVNMAQSPERAANHLVDEAAWPFEFDDLRGESLCQSEVLSFEGHEITELQQSAQPPRLDDSLVAKRGAFGVYADVAGEVEADFRRSGDQSLDDDRSQAER